MNLIASFALLVVITLVGRLRYRAGRNQLQDHSINYAIQSQERDNILRQIVKSGHDGDYIATIDFLLRYDDDKIVELLDRKPSLIELFQHDSVLDYLTRHLYEFFKLAGHQPSIWSQLERAIPKESAAKLINTPCTDHGDTILHLLVQELDVMQRHELFTLFIRGPAYYFNINAQNKDGDTALHIVCKKIGIIDNSLTTTSITTLLSSAWIDVNIQNNDGDTPVHIALRRTSPSMTKRALEAITERKRSSPWMALLFDKRVDWTLQNKEGKTPTDLNTQ